VGYDAGKRIKGRKRHLLVDTLGLVLGVVVTPADTTERDGAKAVLLRVLGWFTWLRLLVGRRRLCRGWLCRLGQSPPP
jgi:hypothetical protein